MSSDDSVSFPNMNYKPFSYRPTTNSFPIDPQILIADDENALRNHVDILGWQFFQARNEILDTLTKLGEDQVYREKLGTIKAAKLEAFAKLDPKSRDVALSLAEEAMNHLIDRVAQTIGCDNRGYGGDLCIEHHIECRVFKIVGANANGVKLKKVAKCVITGDAQVTLGGSFGRWLNMFGARPSKNG